MTETKTEELDRQWWNHTAYLVASMFNSAFTSQGAKNFDPFEPDNFNPWHSKDNPETKERKPWIDKSIAIGMKVKQGSPDKFKKAD